MEKNFENAREAGGRGCCLKRGGKDLFGFAMICRSSILEANHWGRFGLNPKSARIQGYGDGVAASTKEMRE